MTVIITPAIALEIADLVAGKVDGGSFRIYDGARPANPGVAVGAQVLLAEGTFGTPAFTAAAMVGNVAVAAAEPIADLVGVGTGNATWVRILDSADVAQWDGSVTNEAGAGDLKLTSTAVGVGSTLIVLSFNVRAATGQ